MNELARMVANGIQNDKSAQAYCNLSAEDQESMAIAYAKSEIKKYERFAMKLQTSPEAKDIFSKFVMSII